MYNIYLNINLNYYYFEILAKHKKENERKNLNFKFFQQQKLRNGRYNFYFNYIFASYFIFE